MLVVFTENHSAWALLECAAQANDAENVLCYSAHTAKKLPHVRRAASNFIIVAYILCATSAYYTPNPASRVLPSVKHTLHCAPSVLRPFRCYTHSEHSVQRLWFQPDPNHTCNHRDWAWTNAFSAAATASLSVLVRAETTIGSVFSAVVCPKRMHVAYIIRTGTVGLQYCGLRLLVP